jgi:hypothetical protein
LAAVGDNAVSTADASRLLDALEEALEDLRLYYEKYFIGIERQAPGQRHRDVKAQVRRLEELRIRSTVVRFRLAGLRARLVTYEYYWTRVLGQIEKGTYRRDLQRSQRRARESVAASPVAASPQVEASQVGASEAEPEAEPEADAPRPRGVGVDVPRPRGVTEITVPQPMARPPGPPRPPPPPVPVPGMKGVEVRRLFQDLVQAKRAAGEEVDGLSERALARKLARELPKLREQHGGPVKFEVATVAGKVRLRARPVAEVE